MPQSAFSLLDDMKTAATAPNMAAWPWLQSFRRRNVMLDEFFYDVGALEALWLAAAPFADKEGSLLIVPPTGGGDIEHFADLGEYAAGGGESVRTVAVAGVGSSALGTAALARNVADAVGEPVCGLVSGYGVADVMSEALGGWFIFRRRNLIDHAVEEAGAVFQNIAMPGTGLDAPLTDVSGSPDTLTLFRLLADGRFPVERLVGHSKGNLVIADTLYALVDWLHGLGRPAPADLHIVTVSAMVYMPNAFRRVTDVMGEIDWFGRLNSSPALEPDVVVPGAWHHTNPALPHALKVTEALKP
ncbi:MAG: hypothetical protein GC201_14290, partial [Alphaproteobacteria bacterium]|nr:hypothetical protein [Alphaproteobacteria bacterium]